MDAPVSGIRAEIREAWSQSRDAENQARDIERFREALAAQNITLARATLDEARTSQEQAKAYPERLREYEQAQAATATGRYASLEPETKIKRPYYSPALKDGEIVAIDPQGQVYKFDERSTGQFREQINERLFGLDTADLPSVTEAKAAQREASRAEWVEQWKAAREEARPASWLETLIAECGIEAGKDGGQVVRDGDGRALSRAERLADSFKPEEERTGKLAPVYGAEGFAERLDDAGIALVQVTADDVKARDALRQAEELTRLSADVNYEARRSHSFAFLEEGDFAAVTRDGDVYRINPDKLRGAEPLFVARLRGNCPE